MQMGAYRKKPVYQQENAMDNAAVLMGLQEMMGKNVNDIGNTVDEYGKSRVRGEVSDLMGTKEFEGMNPAEAQAAIAKISRGRDLGENFMKTLGMSDSNKVDLQNEEQDMLAAEVLFGRQMAKQAQGFANSQSLQNSGHKNSIALANLRNSRSGTNGTGTGGLTAEQYAQNNLAMDGYSKVMNDKNRSEKDRVEAKRRFDMIKFSQTKAVSGKSLTQRQRESLSGDNWKGSTGSAQKLVNGKPIQKNPTIKWGNKNGFTKKVGKVTYLLDDNANWIASKGDAMTNKYLNMRANQ